MSTVPSVDLTPIGTTRGLPDGGSQVMTAYGWKDGHSREAREAVAKAKAATKDDGHGLHNHEAEQALLGCIFYDGEALDALGALRDVHFWEGVHGRLFHACQALRRAERAIDIILVHERLKDDPALIELGGLRYLGDLVDHAPPAVNAPDYARVIYDLAIRRELIREAHATADAAQHDRDRSAEEIAAEGERRLVEVALRGSTRDAWLDGGAIVAAAVADARQRDGRIDFTSGLADLDALTNGYQRGELAIEAGRPAMGKSIRGLQIVSANAKRGKGSAFFSLEMATTPLGLRLACDHVYEPGKRWDGEYANPTMDRAMKNLLSAHQARELERASLELSDLPALFDVRPGITVTQIEACARRAIRSWERRGIEPGPIVIDHLTIVKPERERSGNKVAEVGDISRALAEMAKRLDVPVIALCQLSRGVEGRDDKRPTLADLRWSGEIEQDARQVTFIYRPEYYLRPPEDGRRETEEQVIAREAARNKLFLIVAKNNNGPLGQVEAFCDVSASAIRDRRFAV